MKRLLILTAFILMSITAMAQEQTAVASDGNDFSIVKDELVEGVRYVTAVPSAKVCSNKIEIEIVGEVIQKVVYTRGCEGNAKGIGALVKDMTVEEAIRRLEGITCGKRGTSCPDQLAKVLKSLK
jgi:uncharacterized protein (TIGR03905 family)